MSKKSRLDQTADDILRTLNDPHEAVALAAASALQKARDVGSGPLRQQHLRSAQSHIARINATRNAGLVQRLQAQALALQGRGGDTAIAHVTPGEIVIPRSLQTPEFIAALTAVARAQGLDPRELFVGNGRNAINPRTGQMEFADDENDDAALPSSQDSMPPLQSLQGFQPNLEGSFDPSTVTEIPSPTVRLPFSLDDIDPATRTVYAEARGENPQGRQAVLNSMLNRVGSPTFPRTLNDVIYQKDGNGNYQYQGVDDPSFNIDPTTLTGPNKEAWDQIHDMVQSGIQDAMDGSVPFGPRYYRGFGTKDKFFDQSLGSGRLIRMGAIGNHEFFDTPDRAYPNGRSSN